MRVEGFSAEAHHPKDRLARSRSMKALFSAGVRTGAYGGCGIANAEVATVREARFPRYEQLEEAALRKDVSAPRSAGVSIPLKEAGEVVPLFSRQAG